MGAAGGAPEPLAMWEHVASRLTERDAGKSGAARRARQHPDRLLPDLGVRRRCLPEALHIGPAPPFVAIGNYSGHRRNDHATVGEWHAASRCCALARWTSCLHHQAPRHWPPKSSAKSEGERYSASFAPAERSPFPWESAPDPIEVAHEVFQAWLTSALFDNATATLRGCGIGLDATYRAEIGEMLAPMTQIAAAQSARLVPRSNVHRRRDHRSDARQPHGRSLSVHQGKYMSSR